MKNFKTLNDIQKYLDDTQKKLSLDFHAVDDAILMLKANKVSSATVDLDLTGDPNRKYEKRPIKVDFPLAKVPNAKQLEKDYWLAEKLTKQYNELLLNESSMKVVFTNATNANYLKLAMYFSKLKKDIEKKLRELFKELNRVAEGHAPVEFKKFIAFVAKNLDDNQHIECDNISTFTYASMNKKRELVFAGYIVLHNAISDEGNMIPSLYVTVAWTVGGGAEIFVEHEFIPPMMLTGGASVKNSKDAVKEIIEQLTLEGFSSQIGNLPVHLQLNYTSPSAEIFSIGPMLKSVEAVKDNLIFHFKNSVSGKAIDECKVNLYLEIRNMLKKKRSTQVRMRTDLSQKLISFTFSNLTVEGVTPHDLEWLQDKYKLNDSQLRKISNEINGG